MTKSKVTEYGGDLYNADCFDVFPHIKEGSIDMVLCDLPYGVTDCAWDSVLPFDQLWDALERIVKPKGAIVLTATNPFASAAVSSKYDWFRHDWVFEKNNHSNFMTSKIMPLRYHEYVLVFGKQSPNYYPIMTARKNRLSKAFYAHGPREIIGRTIKAGKFSISDMQYPGSVQKFDVMRRGDAKGHHPTQKPVSLFEYMIKTYSLPGETVLDMTVGSGTTAIAAINTGRKYICVEHDKAIYKRMVDRVRTHWHATAAWRRKHGEKMIADEMKAKEAFFKLLKQRGERGGGESERVRIAK